jgi:hypothetical protein
MEHLSQVTGLLESIAKVKEPLSLESRLLTEALSDSQKFLLPPDGRLFEKSPSYATAREFAKDLRIPFENITLEYSLGNYTLILFISADLSEKTGSPPHTILLFIKVSPGHWVLFPHQCRISGFDMWKNDQITFETLGINKKFLKYCPTESVEKETIPEMLSPVVQVVLDFLLTLSCKNVTTATIEEPKHLNKKRMAKGRVPFFSHHVIVVDNNSTQYERGSTGGSHASPRFHIRRGHIRRHPTAGNLWIQPMKVGDLSKGMITKEYKVKGLK